MPIQPGRVYIKNALLPRAGLNAVVPLYSPAPGWFPGNLALDVLYSVSQAFERQLASLLLLLPVRPLLSLFLGPELRLDREGLFLCDSEPGLCGDLRLGRCCCCTWAAKAESEVSVTTHQ
jgi:hypothetical protein